VLDDLAHARGPHDCCDAHRTVLADLARLRAALGMEAGDRG